MHKVLEPEIKSSLINKLRSKGTLASCDCIVNEFNVGDYSRRADLLIAQNGRIQAFEIKSESDSLTRLQDQVTKYLEYFDKVTVVVAPKHTNKAMELTPSNVAVWEIAHDKIKIMRRGKLKIIKDKKKLIELMTVNDIKKSLSALKLKHAYQKRRGLELQLCQQPIYKVREQTVKAIKSRFNQTSKAFLAAISERLSTPEDLHLLRPNPNPISEEKFHINNFIDAISHIKQGIQ